MLSPLNHRLFGTLPFFCKYFPVILRLKTSETKLLFQLKTGIEPGTPRSITEARTAGPQTLPQNNLLNEID